MIDLVTPKRQFEEDRYAIVRGVIDPVGLGIIQRTYKHHNLDLIEHGQTVGDGQCKDRLPGRRWPITGSVLTELKDVVQAVVGREIVASYAYAALYVPGAVLKRHVDRHACEITCTLTVENHPNEIWPIYLNDPVKGREHTVRADLNPGDLLVYHGTKFPHWRDAQPAGHYNMSIFLHYMYADSPIIDKLQESSRYMADLTLEDAIVGKVRPPA